MTNLPIEPGEFVWCAFPERENPDKPSRHLHVVYALVVALATPGTGGSGISGDPRAVVAYTTSRPWPIAARRPGVIPFTTDEAEAVGQTRPFWLHLWRVAYVPVTPIWFPQLGNPGHGVVGRLTQAKRLEIEAAAIRVQIRHEHDVERLGPHRPKR
ncbi:MAG: hypothetical protein P4L48_22330 [Mycobacterium sp.]|nr:hypothetical protein [Mycobacterium sp.]